MLRVAIVMGVLLVIAVGLYLMGTSEDRRARREFKAQHKMTPEDKKELTSLREMRDSLLDLTLERIDVEPFAHVVLDEIRKQQRKEITK